jgi:hypothetical protein
MAVNYGGICFITLAPGLVIYSFKVVIVDVSYNKLECLLQSNGRTGIVITMVIRKGILLNGKNQ